MIKETEELIKEERIGKRMNRIEEEMMDDVLKKLSS